MTFDRSSVLVFAEDGERPSYTDFFSRFFLQPLRIENDAGPFARIKEWARQFEGRTVAMGSLVDYTPAGGVFNYEVPHQLGRKPAGAFFVGWNGPAIVSGGTTTRVDIDLTRSTERIVWVRINNSALTQSIRLLVF